MLFQTVASVSYLPLAFVLARSLAEHVPGSRLCILVTDASASCAEKLQNKFGHIAEFISCEMLGVSGMANMRRYYTVFEFSSACKALALDYQLRQCNEPECCFIDPDMLVTGDFTPALQAVERDIVMTHHTTAPYPQDGKSPTEMELVTTGIINGGIIYARRSESSLRALHWLVVQTQHNWFFAPGYGMFCDQHWLSFLTYFFRDITGICYHPGINIAYWNLHERPLYESSGKITVESSLPHPALLFHFSGFPRKTVGRLTQHSNRRFDAQTEQVLSHLIADYRERINAQDSMIQKTLISADLGFCQWPLRKRMALAEKLCKHRFIPLVQPTGIFASIGHKLDKLLAGL